MHIHKIGIEFKEIRENQTNCHIIADIVVVDRTTSEISPKLYILKDNRFIEEKDLDALKNGYLHFDKDAFIQLGEVTLINKKKKHIILSNGNTLSYKKMIVASGTKQSILNNEFLPAFKTLIDALRVKEKIPSSFGQTTPSSGNSNPPHHLFHQTSERLKTMDSIDAKFQIEPSPPRDLSLSGVTKRLYEVQT